jgi:hypothetical protein
MSNQWYQPTDFDDDDGDEGQGQGQPNAGQQQLPKGLRSQLAKVAKENKELKETNEKLLKQVRETAISQVLTTKGVSVKLAKLVPADIEPTAEAVEKWLEEYSDVFPVKAAEGETGKTADGQDGDGETGADGDEAAAMALIAQAANGGQAPGKQADLLKQLSSKDLTRDQLLALIEAHGGGLGAG